MNQENLCKKHGLDKTELDKSIDVVVSCGLRNLSNIQHMVAIANLLINGDIKEE